MKKIRAAIVGYGNIGKYVLEALESSTDFEVAGIVRRNANEIPPELQVYTVTDKLEALENVNVAILATPTRQVEKFALEALALGINTVDSFDIHSQIVALRHTLDAAAKQNGAVSIIAAGWDPGSDSVVRAMLEAMVPNREEFAHVLCPLGLPEQSFSSCPHRRAPPFQHFEAGRNL